MQIISTQSKHPHVWLNPAATWYAATPLPSATGGRASPISPARSPRSLPSPWPSCGGDGGVGISNYIICCIVDGYSHTPHYNHNTTPSPPHMRCPPSTAAAPAPARRRSGAPRLIMMLLSTMLLSMTLMSWSMAAAPTAARPPSDPPHPHGPTCRPGPTGGKGRVNCYDVM